MFNNTNLMKKGGALQVTNTKEFLLNCKFYLTRTLLGAFIKFGSEKKLSFKLKGGVSGRT